MKETATRLKWLLLTFLMMAGCQATISPFSPTAYEQATSLKVEALVLIDKATQPYTEHKTEVEALRIEIDKAYEYAKGRPKNKDSAEQWQILRNPKGNSIGGFLKRWETRGQLEQEFVTQAKGDIAAGFDMVIELESGKRKADSTPGS